MSVAGDQKTEENVVRKWEDLELDCLVNIFGRLGIEPLLYDVPFVCKSWHKASFHPLCWRDIEIPYSKNILYGLGYFYSPLLRRFMDAYSCAYSKLSIDGFIRLLLSRGLGKSPSRVLTGGCHYHDLECLAEKCPDLKSLKIRKYIIVKHDDVVVKVIGKLKQLEEIELPIDYPAGILVKIVALIGQNCKNFDSLILREGEIHNEDVLAIVNHLPNLKKLSMESCRLAPEDLIIVLKNCKRLEHLNLCKCSVTSDWDEKKFTELASHVKALNLDVLLK